MPVGNEEGDEKEEVRWIIKHIWLHVKEKDVGRQNLNNKSRVLTWGGPQALGSDSGSATYVTETNFSELHVSFYKTELGP